VPPQNVQPGPGPRTPLRPANLVAAAALALAGLLPIANWIPGGARIGGRTTPIEGWAYGTLSAVLLALLLAIAWRRLALPWRAGFWADLGRKADAHPARTSAVLGATAFVLYAAVSTWIFDRRPLLIDEIIQLFQAHIFASGRLWLPASGLPEFFGAMHLVETATRVYGQFPPGAPAMLLPGVAAGAAWLAVPCFGAVSAAVWPVVLRRIEPEPGVRLGAALLFAFTPFTFFLSGSYMNHVTVLTWTLVALAGAAMVSDGGEQGQRPGWAFVSGLGLGIGATVRPLDAFAFAVPAALWYLARALRTPRRWREALAALAGVALPMTAMFWINDLTNGSPFRFGYQVLWGSAHDLGFHPAPWGPDHTPLRGLELTNLYLLRLQTYFLETPFPALLPLLGAVALFPRRLGAFDRILAGASLLLAALYFAYWHDGFYLGPRFYFPLAPVLALWTARFPGLVRGRWGDGLRYRVAVWTLIVGGVVAATSGLSQRLNRVYYAMFRAQSGIPLRAQQYRNGLLTMRWNADSAVAAAGLGTALVLVRESWGSQLAVRLWGLGLARADAERIYANTDACRLEESISALERAAVRGDEAKARLWPLIADSARLEPMPFSQDRSARWQPGLPYTPRCASRLWDDRRGFTLYTPLINARAPGVVFARDLHERTAVLLDRYPGRTLFLLKPVDDAIGAPLRFYPVDRDSMRRAWSAPDTVSVMPPVVPWDGPETPWRPRARRAPG
jgi:hypothetical protein